ncbi:diphthamide biosynthesis protein 2 [Spizellomyces punctatus DAOM BR117]|uniref:2-(3-amino-3-carboxypropyl)histidine synthase subunit 2 n=1 Tax=Spizellomyces punctatus (strain DAOM BR117) TaxID=645134 RepID=A0A0L0HDX8_SPIPD|nr:diphthamide biosynthesis protein 2 [Spizellomyces punctatus DAOM BR117]KNC98973.1 diphthamide biosynthesis protein 2 [Spizellomyces punctatus DAOM BR117]|eukprot:XP_016607013.1 diphthamide biosynthesis protein 2 [Spizellomyces punctatus DAOM BR117]
MTSVLNGPTSFADDGRTVIERKMDTGTARQRSTGVLGGDYEIERTSQVIIERGYSKIALQFPDELLPDSAEVSTALKERTGKEIFILADTTFGSCCVDEIAAEHGNADLVVHYGRACLSPTSRLPVLYVFGKAPIDVHDCARAFDHHFSAQRNQPVLLMYDVMYHHVIISLMELLHSHGYTDVLQTEVETELFVPPKLQATELDEQRTPSPTSSECCDKSMRCCKEDLRRSPLASTPSEVTETDESTCRQSACGRRFTIPPHRTLADYSIFYIGGESLTLTNIILTNSRNKVFSYDPDTGVHREETGAQNKLLMRRYYMVQSAKDANVIGIVVGTLGVASYLSVINHIKRLIIASGKKPYVLAVGKPNPAKLGNFLEIDCFVLVACPENSLLDSRDFLRPIVTPFELELALVRGKEWTGDYETDLTVLASRLQSGADDFDNGADDEASSDEEPYFSLVTGGYKQATRYLSTSNVPTRSSRSVEDAPGQLTLRNAETGLTKLSTQSAAAQYLNERRTFRGLVPDVGNTDVTVAVDGRRGIARGYVGETGKSEQLNQTHDTST